MAKRSSGLVIDQRELQASLDSIQDERLIAISKYMAKMRSGISF